MSRALHLLAALALAGTAAPLGAQQPQRVALIFTDSIVTIGSTAKPRVQVRGYATDAAPSLRFVSSAPNVLAVDARGEQMVARRRGTASLSVSLIDPGSGEPVAWRTFLVRVVARRLSVRPPLDELVLPGQTTRLVATAQDARGNMLADVAATWTSLDPDILAVARDGVATALSSGGARVRAAFDLDTVTLVVPVRLRPGAQPIRLQAGLPVIGARRPDLAATGEPERADVPRTPDRSAPTTAAAPFGTRGGTRPEPPPGARTAAPGVATATPPAAPGADSPSGVAAAFVPAPPLPATASAAAVLDSIVAAGAVGAVPWRWSMTAELIAARIEHETRVEGTSQNASGTALGVGLAYAPRTWLTVQGRFLTGGLSAVEGSTEDRDIAEGDIGVAVSALPWLAVQVGATSRGFSTDLGRQRWSGLRTGLEGRLPFIGGRAIGIVGVGVMPVVSVSGQEAPSLPLLVSAGMEYRSGLVWGRLLYAVERYEFASDVGRAEQLASLRAGLGVRLPR